MKKKRLVKALDYLDSEKKNIRWWSSVASVFLALLGYKFLVMGVRDGDGMYANYDGSPTPIPLIYYGYFSVLAIGIAPLFFRKFFIWLQSVFIPLLILYIAFSFEAIVQLIVNKGLSIWLVLFVVLVRYYLTILAIIIRQVVLYKYTKTILLISTVLSVYFLNLFLNHYY